jgi:hypothetical protein
MVTGLFALDGPRRKERGVVFHTLDGNARRGVSSIQSKRKDERERARARQCVCVRERARDSVYVRARERIVCA